MERAEGIEPPDQLEALEALPRASCQLILMDLSSGSDTTPLGLKWLGA